MDRLGLLLKSSRVVITSRTRAEFYKPRTKGSWVPRFVRVYFYQNPKAPFYISAGVVACLIFYPLFGACHAFFTLDKEDYLDYKHQHDAVARDRAKYGIDLYIPFFNKDKSVELYDFYRQRTLERRAAKKAAEQS